MINDVLQLWKQLDDVAHPYLTPITDEAQYQAALDFLDVLWGRVGENPDSPYAFQIVRDHIVAYEAQRFSIPDAPPYQTLRQLMTEQGLTQEHIAKHVNMHQSNLSQVLQRRSHWRDVFLPRDFWRGAILSCANHDGEHCRV
jgi:HTH-type transcriptional regulator / antitoxin HigA